MLIRYLPSLRVYKYITTAQYEPMFKQIIFNIYIESVEFPFLWSDKYSIPIMAMNTCSHKTNLGRILEKYSRIPSAFLPQLGRSPTTHLPRFLTAYQSALTVCLFDISELVLRRFRSSARSDGNVSGCSVASKLRKWTKKSLKSEQNIRSPPSFCKCNNFHLSF